MPHLHPKMLHLPVEMPHFPPYVPFPPQKFPIFFPMPHFPPKYTFCPQSTPFLSPTDPLFSFKPHFPPQIAPVQLSGCWVPLHVPPPAPWGLLGVCGWGCLRGAAPWGTRGPPMGAHLQSRASSRSSLLPASPQVAVPASRSAATFPSCGAHRCPKTACSGCLPPAAPTHGCSPASGPCSAAGSRRPNGGRRPPKWR